MGGPVQSEQTGGDPDQPTLEDLALQDVLGDGAAPSNSIIEAQRRVDGLHAPLAKARAASSVGTPQGSQYRHPAPGPTLKHTGGGERSVAPSEIVIDGHPSTHSLRRSSRRLEAPGSPVAAATRPDGPPTLDAELSAMLLPAATGCVHAFTAEEPIDPQAAVADALRILRICGTRGASAAQPPRSVAEVKATAAESLHRVRCLAAALQEARAQEETVGDARLGALAFGSVQQANRWRRAALERYGRAEAALLRIVGPPKRRTDNRSGFLPSLARAAESPAPAAAPDSAAGSPAGGPPRRGAPPQTEPRFAPVC